jgi:hypothetical protein
VEDHSSPGVFLISQAVAVGNAVEELLLIWAASDQSEWANQPRGSAPCYPRRAPRLVGGVCFGALLAPLDRCTAGEERDNEYRIRVWSRTAVQLTYLPL